MSEETILEKPIRKRALKERKTFFKHQIESSSFVDICINNESILEPLNPERYLNDPNMINLYTNYIPLTYLFINKLDYLDHSSVDFVMRNSFLNNKKIPNYFFANMFCRKMHNDNITNVNSLLDITNSNINNFINFSEFAPLSTYIDHFVRGMGIDDFINTTLCKTSYTGRLIRLANLHNSLYYRYISSHSDDQRYIPTYISVVLPENYLYQKYHLLLTGKIDPTKVIVLVNDDVDHPTFSGSQSVRRYHKIMLNKIISQGYQTWNVPEKFILDNCFVKTFKIKEKSVREIQQKKEQLIDEFNKYMVDKYVQKTDEKHDEDKSTEVEYIRTTVSGDSHNIAIDMLTGSATYNISYSTDVATNYQVLD